MNKDVSKKMDKLVGIKITHRGLWNKENPENSIGAYKRSISNNLPIENKFERNPFGLRLLVK